MENYTRYPIPHPGVETTRPDSFPYAKHQISDSARSSARSSDSFARNSSLHYDGEHRGSHESKPRLSKEQQDILERHFRSQPKPSTSTKRGFADNLEVPLDKINVSVPPPSVLAWAKPKANHLTELVSESTSQSEARRKEATIIVQHVLRESIGSWTIFS